MKIETLFLVGIGVYLLLRFAIERPLSQSPMPSALATNLKLPFTQHADGHYYDANGVLVS
jgi:hypothetical protein